MITQEEIEFLRESNNIEEEYDDLSLRDAILAWQYCKKQKKLTSRIILEVHTLLMKTRDTIENTQKGVFRTGPVWIGRREGHPWFTIQESIEDFVQRLNDLVANTKRTKILPNEEIIKQDHILYEHIHPFFDGNGRTGRIFYNWERIKCGLPIHIIEAATKYEEYYTWFK